MVKGNAQVNDESLTVTGMKWLQLVVVGNTQGSCRTIKHVSWWSREHKIRKLSLYLFSWWIYIPGVYRLWSHNLEDGCSTRLQSSGAFLPDYTVSHFV